MSNHADAICVLTTRRLCRYYVLIEFAAYVSEPQFDPTSPQQVSFARWLAARPELHR